MALERDLELLDDYISNKLNAEERSAFEQTLQSNQELKREHALQQKVAEGLRQARIQELKTMLNNIPVPSTSGGEISVGVKTLVGVVAAGLVATGIYFYFKGKEETAPQAPVTQTAPETKTDVTKAVEQPAETTGISAVTPATTPENEPAEKSSAVTKPQVKEETTQVSKPAITPKQKDSTAEHKIDVFDPTEEAGNKAHTEGATADGTVKANKSSMTVKTDSNNKKYNFHYQFKNGELYLYGPFDKKLIEIMEFFSENKHTVFLFHENKYYLLNEASDKVKPLTAITDPALIKKLKEHRGN
ncbi:MAG TPA: hypothetical protein VIN08_17055 [Ohtaekwangia sp.]|uniref:anti-sigma factor family protein n=1 Tax=Ohtaekwangia sp. TaxID=2066019 RepID=UPI002F948736